MPLHKSCSQCLTGFLFNALSRWHIIPSSLSSILEVNNAALLDIKYPSVEYYFDRGRHFLLPSRDDCEPDRIIAPWLRYVYTDGSILKRSLLWELGMNISLRLPDYCSVFQAEAMVKYRDAQWILNNVNPFTHIPIFSGNQAAIRSLSTVMSNSRIVRKCLGTWTGLVHSFRNPRQSIE